MPVPATLTSYLPVLLVSVTHSAAPDDSSFSTLPEGQVDYLSHEWREEDVWRSWRSMTRQKNAIANGMRLENASWRTWWKQRNKLKTVSPETLNWLKDSDVTWLYGPLHVGSDWTPSSNKQDTLTALQRKTSLEEISPSKKKQQITAPYTTKPILKRRSISQLLSLPASPFFAQPESDEEESAELEREGATSPGPARPPLLHTKSDTHISWRGRPYRKVSPPRIIAQETPLAPLSTTPATSDSSDQDLSGSSSTGADGSASGVSSTGAKKKHISFNTFVEQCIAIEKPKLKRSNLGPPVYESYDDGYEEDSEVAYDEEDDEPASFYIEHRDSPAGSDSDDDDDVIEMRTSSSRSRSSSASSSRSPRFATVPLPGSKDPSPSGSNRSHHGLSRRASAGGDRVTIAPIAPTLLKSTGFGNEVVDRSYGKGRAAKDVELVYVPPSNSTYNHPNTPANGSHEDVYHHRESYFSVGTSGQRVPITSVDALPPPYQTQPTAGSSQSHSRGLYVHPPLVESPQQMHAEMGGQDAALEDAYDYFEGPDLGEDFGDWRAQMGRRRQSRREQREREEGAGAVRYAEGGTASVTTGRSARSAGRGSPDVPVVVVNEVNGAMEERKERSREGSPSPPDHIEQTVVKSEFAGSLDQPHSATHSIPFASSPAVPVPRLGASPHIAISPQSTGTAAPASASVSTDPSRLSPPEAALCRGRPSSVSGSTTTGSFSRSSDSASRSDSRGRSLTRTPSFSDRDRSSSHGTSSPIGSISPTGSALGIAAGSYSGRGRDRDGRSVMRAGRGDVERGRNRSGRKLGDSTSPPSVLGSPTRSGSDMEYQPYSPTLVDAVDSPIERGRAPSPPSSISGSSTASVSTIVPSRQSVGETDASMGRPRLTLGSPHAKIVAVPIPSPIPEEDEQRSRHPTPANSPVTVLHPMGHARQESVSKEKSPITTPPHSAPWQVTPPAIDSPAPALESPAADRSRKVADARAEQQSGTLVGRAVEIVTSARGFLGSIWNAGTS
ncbi:hypothetical protein OBBRIDRAFT_798913 [Obba rivulosa]|uniref:Nitrogen regulatory protein areA GATA-like domain-containing protein n=1 Tax=Obba rivulosa TaxID=1052685 RepID=A0A8E2DGA4_9APHY|nr:hypothetical protein OBBRIDRAFT_798913 [Obba rivulosa]